eukprot:scaffold2905_cov88-Skeletonema_dohrnii-CCMP3373.AAC.3
MAVGWRGGMDGSYKIVPIECPIPIRLDTFLSPFYYLTSSMHAAAACLLWRCSYLISFSSHRKHNTYIRTH